MSERYMDAEGMRNWAQIKKLEDERHQLEKKITELTRRLQEVEEEIGRNVANRAILEMSNGMGSLSSEAISVKGLILHMMCSKGR